MGKGFELNSYDICMENKTVNGKQWTPVWYVDDNKVLHTEEKIVGDLINDLKKHLTWHVWVTKNDPRKNKWKETWNTSRRQRNEKKLEKQKRVKDEETRIGSQS